MAVAGLKPRSPGLQCWGSFAKAASVSSQVLRGPRTGPRWSRGEISLGGRLRAGWGGVGRQAPADAPMGDGELREEAFGGPVAKVSGVLRGIGG